MAQTYNPPGMTVADAKSKIFNKLCVAYRQSRQDPAFGLRADDVRTELNIPVDIFAMALETFVDAKNERIVEVFDKNGKSHLRLGISARHNLTD